MNIPMFKYHHLYEYILDPVEHVWCTIRMEDNRFPDVDAGVILSQRWWRHTRGARLVHDSGRQAVSRDRLKPSLCYVANKNTMYQAASQRYLFSMCVFQKENNGVDT